MNANPDTAMQESTFIQTSSAAQVPTLALLIAALTNSTVGITISVESLNLVQNSASASTDPLSSTTKSKIPTRVQPRAQIQCLHRQLHLHNPRTVVNRNFTSEFGPSVRPGFSTTFHSTIFTGYAPGLQVGKGWAFAFDLVIWRGFR